MSKHGSENYSYEYRDIQATTMALDRTGKFALLAGRKYLGVVDLENNGNVLARLPFGGKYEISKCQWSEEAKLNIFAVASSQRCDIFELTEDASLKRLFQLRAHTRVITDLDWATISPSLLATSSFDSYLHIWDIRVGGSSGESEKSVLSLPALDGASQVTWNKWKGDILASCDGGHVKIWDIRNPTTPSEYIPAHASKINGLEWVTKDSVITAAQDCTAKLSPVGSSAKLGLNRNLSRGQPITLSTPIWRARPTPFGRGILTQCVPLLRRDSGLLSLWNWDSLTSPIFTFQGHEIVEFGWRRTRPQGASPELVTWSRDQVLRLWTLPPEIFDLCGDESSEESRRDKEANIETEVLKDVPKKRKGSQDDVLHSEIGTILLKKSPHVNFEQLELERGLLRFGWRPDKNKGVVSIVICVSFPHNYPASPPTFLVTSGGHDIDKNALIKILKTSATAAARRSEPCLETVISLFTQFMTQIKPLEEVTNNALFLSRGASNVPFPRTSGARFCSVGLLICFGRPAYLKRVKSNSDACTPRSLSSLGPFLSQLTQEASPSNLSKSRRSKKYEKKEAGLVTLFDVTPLLPLSKELGEEYEHSGGTSSSRLSTIDHNYEVVKKRGAKSLKYAWAAFHLVAKYTTTPTTPPYENEERRVSLRSEEEDEEESQWQMFHPLGTSLVHSMISHYGSYGDVQTAALAASIFSPVSYGRNGDDESLALAEEAVEERGKIKNYPSLKNNINNNGGSSSLRSIGNLLSHLVSHKSHSLSLTFQPKTQRSHLPKYWIKGGVSPYHTISGGSVETSASPWLTDTYSPKYFHQRSNSWSDSNDEERVGPFSPNEELALISLPQQNSLNTKNLSIENSSKAHPLLLYPSMFTVYDRYKKSYAEILYRWGLLQSRSEVLKYMSEGFSSGSQDDSLVQTFIKCSICSTTNVDHRIFCPSCSTQLTNCSICTLPVKGLSSYCLVCCHGGHLAHVQKWFSRKRECPAGCGCNCVIQNNRMFT